MTAVGQLIIDLINYCTGTTAYNVHLEQLIFFAKNTFFSNFFLNKLLQEEIKMCTMHFHRLLAIPMKSNNFYSVIFFDVFHAETDT